MDSNADLQKAIEDTLTQIGRENAKVMAAQLVSLVEQIRNGGTSKVTLMWDQIDVPPAIKELIYADRERAEILKTNHGFYFAILLPTGRTEFPSGLVNTAYEKHLTVSLPQNKLLVYY